MAKHKNNGHGHVTETPDVSHIRNLDVTHETSDVSVGGILKFVVGLTLFAVVVHVLMWGMFRLLAYQEDLEPPPGPMAMTEEERLPPAPRLQAARGFGVQIPDGEWVNLENREPEAEYRVLYKQWQRELNCSDGSESSHESVANPSEHGEHATKAPCVPVADAIEKVLAAGLPSRRQDDSATSPGLRVPTAESSGRVMGKP
jgi:hypothetical protein